MYHYLSHPTINLFTNLANWLALDLQYFAHTDLHDPETE